MSTAYTWTVTSVDLAGNTFVAEYKSDGKPTVHLNLALPSSLDTIKSIVESAAPLQMWLKPAQNPPSQLLAADVLGQLGAAVAAVPDPAVLSAAGKEEFKKRVCEVLFDIGVTPTNRYTAPV